jgi:hypothetical protein
MESTTTLSPSLTRYAWLSIAAAIATILLKGVAWWLTGSVGLLSDAIESFVNLAGALMALWMLTLAARPADDNHTYGYSKAEYFSSAFEGCLSAVSQFDVPMFTYGDGCGDMLNALSVARSWTTVGQERPRRVDPGALPQTPHSP